MTQKTHDDEQQEVFYSRMFVEKAFDEGDGQRIIEGVASTADIDRMGDIVEPEGVKFALPLPLLFHHDSQQAVGIVEKASVTKKGIRFRARLAKVDGPPQLKNRIDDAWAQVKAGLINAVSIGFRAIEHSIMESGGVHFRQWDWLELSLVTVPANPNATITQIRAYAEAHSGMSAAKDAKPSLRRSVALTPAHVAATTKPSVQGKEKMNIADQIKSLEDDIRRKRDKMTEIQTKAAEAGRTKDADEKTQFDTLGDDIEALESELADWKKLQSQSVEKAAPARGDADQQAADARAGLKTSVKFNESRDEPGIGFSQHIKCMAIARGDGFNAERLAKEHYSYDPRVAMLCKAAVAGGVTTASAWAGTLADPQDLVSEFVAWMRPRTLLGRIPGVKNVPFNVDIPRQTAASTAAWTGDGKPTPVSALAFDKITIGRTALSGSAYISKRNLRFANVQVDRMIRDDLGASIIELTDTDFVDPANSGTTNVKPASITDGLTPISPSGADVADLKQDLQTLIKPLVNAKLPVSEIVLITNDQLALAISLMVNALEEPAFPEMGPTGGMLHKMPVITSMAVKPGDIIALHAPSLYVADEDEVAVDMSDQASIQADSAPSQDGAAGTGSTVLSLWQNRMVGFLAERYVNWVVSRANSVAFIGTGAYGGAPSA